MNIGLVVSSNSEHKHKCYEIIIYIKGSAIFSAKDTKQIVQTGSVIIVPPDCAHKSDSINCSERIFINGEFNQFFNLKDPIILTDNADNEAVFLAKMIYKNRYREDEYLSSLINTFVYHIIENIHSDIPINKAIKNIITVFNEQFFDSNLNLKAVLNNSGYAEDYIRSKFKKVTGKTPIMFLTEMRISHACILIENYKNTLSLNEIAEKCGYTDYVYFSRRFKQIKGISPQKYMNLC